MRVHWFQHVPFEGLGSIAPWLEAQNHRVSVTRLWAGELPPAASEFDWLIVMGGPMNIYEEEPYPWLAVEKRCLRDAIAADRRVLGICLGAQLVADVLGARVTRNGQKEIGWFEVELTGAAQAHHLFQDFPGRFDAYHWHGDTFGIPAGAEHVARSRACANQAFVHGPRVVGLQFHLETTLESARELIANGHEELTDAPFVQTEREMLASAERFAPLNRVMDGLLARLEEA